MVRNFTKYEGIHYETSPGYILTLRAPPPPQPTLSLGQKTKGVVKNSGHNMYKNGYICTYRVFPIRTDCLIFINSCEKYDYFH